MRSAPVLLTLLLAVPLGSCDPDLPPPPTALYNYYTTCPDPVCNGHRDTDTIPCTVERVNDRCTVLGRKCDPNNSCNSLLVCAAKDPKQGGSCPISSRRFKKDIEYVGQPELERYASELQQVKLATYQYREAPEARRHLGFLIEDQAQSMSVDPDRSVVDLYGYTSMAVAALQVQAQRIAALEREVTRLRTDLAVKGRR